MILKTPHELVQNIFITLIERNEMRQVNRIDLGVDAGFGVTIEQFP